jgi:hypothetical protein
MIEKVVKEINQLKTGLEIEEWMLANRAETRFQSDMKGMYTSSDLTLLVEGRCVFIHTNVVGQSVAEFGVSSGNPKILIINNYDFDSFFESLYYHIKKRSL